MARMTATSDVKMPKSVVKIKTSPSIEHKEEVMRVDTRGSWIDPIILYIWDRNFSSRQKASKET